MEIDPLLPSVVASAHGDLAQRRSDPVGEEPAADHAGQAIPLALGETTLVTLVLDNLITNADKYSDPDKPIDVTLSPNESVPSSLDIGWWPAPERSTMLRRL